MSLKYEVYSASQGFRRNLAVVGCIEKLRFIVHTIFIVCIVCFNRLYRLFSLSVLFYSSVLTTFIAATDCFNRLYKLF